MAFAVCFSLALLLAEAHEIHSGNFQRPPETFEAHPGIVELHDSSGVENVNTLPVVIIAICNRYLSHSEI